MQSFAAHRKALKDNNGKTSDQTKQSIRQCITTANALNDELRHITKRIEDENKKHWKKQQKARHDCVVSLKEYFAKNQEHLTQELNNKNYGNEILKIAALIYKVYLDNLYYSGEYRTQAKASIFNAYLAAYQRLTGMMASTGCKSAIDRAYVIRLLTAEMEARDLATSPLPEDCHSTLFSATKTFAKCSDNAMSNAAMYSCIYDTSGAAPKVNAFRFPFLKGIPNLDSIGQFGKYAAHKLYHLLFGWFPNFIKKMIHRIKSFLTKEPTKHVRSNSLIGQALEQARSRAGSRSSDLNQEITDVSSGPLSGESPNPSTPAKAKNNSSKSDETVKNPTFRL